MATIGTLIVCGLIVGIVLLIKHRHKLPNMPDLSGVKSRVKNWWGETPGIWETVWTGEGKWATWIPVIIGLAMSYFIIWWLQSTIFMWVVTRHWKELAIIHVFAVIVISMNPPNKAWKKRIATLVVIELTLWSLVALDIAPWLAEKPKTQIAKGEANSATDSTSDVNKTLTTLLPSKKEDEKTVREFWRKHLESVQAEQMITKAETESNFNQFETNKFPLRGRQNRDNIGVMQINERWWNQVARKIGYNIATLQGNLDMALWMYHRDGERAWKVDPMNHKNGIWNVFDYHISAPPAPGWTDRIPVWGNTYTTMPEKAYYLDAKGQKYDDNKKILPLSDWIVYQSASSEAVDIHIRATAK